MKPLRLAPVWILAALLAACGSSPAATPTPAAPSATATITARHASWTPLPSPRPSKTPIPTKTPRDCSDGWSRLSFGDYADVIDGGGGSPLPALSSPNGAAEVVAQLYPGTMLKLLDGPVCADGAVFWHVEHAAISGGTGWVEEGDFTHYFLARHFYEPAGEYQVAFGGVSFTVPVKVSPKPPGGALCPAGSAEADWQTYPASICFYFPDYIIADNMYVVDLPSSPRNVLRVFEVGEYGSLPGLDIQIDLLRNQIDGRMDLDLGLFLPDLPSMSDSPFATLERKLAFGSGTGVRHLVGDYVPDANEYLLYIFTGITEDGKYLVSVQLPINLRVWSADQMDPGTLVTEIFSNAALSGGCYPSLEALDGMVASIRVSHPAFP